MMFQIKADPDGRDDDVVCEAMTMRPDGKVVDVPSDGTITPWGRDAEGAIPQ